MRPHTLSAEAVLLQLLDRVAASPDPTVRIKSRELAGWPPDAVAALKSQRLLRRTRPATGVVCPGCEQQCAMPVYTVPGPPGLSSRPMGQPSSFIVCDKRDDINRVPVESDRLTQWQSSPDAVCDFVADCLGLRPSGKRTGRAPVMEIGMATGTHRRQMLCLRTEGKLELVAGDGAVALAEVVHFRRGRYGLKATEIRQLVDASMTADARYTPSQARREVRKRDTQARDQALQQAYRKLKRQRPGKTDAWYAQQIAKRAFAGGLSPETIRRNMRSEK